MSFEVVDQGALVLAGAVGPIWSELPFPVGAGLGGAAAAGSLQAELLSSASPFQAGAARSGNSLVNGQQQFDVLGLPGDPATVLDTDSLDRLVEFFSTSLRPEGASLAEGAPSSGGDDAEVAPSFVDGDGGLTTPSHSLGDGSGDSDGDGVPDNHEVTVTGRRKVIDLPPDMPGDPGGIPGGGGGSGGGGVPQPPDGNDCRDRNALDATDAINAERDEDRYEHGSLVYRGADGQVHRTPLIRGNADGITGT